MKRRVCVIYGGRSGEHEVSVNSAESVIGALDKTKYETRAVAITRVGAWIADISPGEYRRRHLGGRSYAVPGERPEEPGRSTEEQNDGKPPSEILNAGRAGSDREVIIPILHGPFGEDGTIQGLLEMLDIPYVGSGVLGSALSMDKAATKHLCLSHGIPVVDFLDFVRPQWVNEPQSVLEAVRENICYPCFVKPANLGSSIGISKVHAEAELHSAVETAFLFDTRIIVEQALNCRELECSVLGNFEPEASVVGEIVPCNEFYDYKAKYVDGKSELIIPAKIDVEMMAEAQQIAIEAFRALNCAGMARADFFMERESEELFFNEINTIPGFTSISMYPKLWEASGLSYSDLLDRLIELAIERHEERQRVCGNVLQPGNPEKT